MNSKISSLDANGQKILVCPECGSTNIGFASAKKAINYNLKHTKTYDSIRKGAPIEQKTVFECLNCEHFTTDLITEEDYIKTKYKEITE